MQNDGPLGKELADVLREAGRITSQDRRRSYGHPLDNHGCTASLFHAYLVRRGWTPPPGRCVGVRDVCMLNILQKISRDANFPQHDNMVDVAGYILNVEQAEQESEARAQAGMAKSLNTPDLTHPGFGGAEGAERVVPW